MLDTSGLPALMYACDTLGTVLASLPEYSLDFQGILCILVDADGPNVVQNLQGPEGARAHGGSLDVCHARHCIG